MKTTRNYRENIDCVSREDIAAVEILKSTGIPVIEAAMVAKLALKAGRGRERRAIKCIELGEKELKKQERTVSFTKAVEAALAARKHRRPRTQTDFRYVSRRFMKKCPGLPTRRLRSISPQECTTYIEQAFDTPRQRQKARLVLSAIFSTAQKQGWCTENPVEKVDAPHVVEKRVDVLTPKQLEQLQETAKLYSNGICRAAVGLMLYAGIRPHEVARLSWEHIDLESGSISILPQHSKTGGTRLVTIHPPLRRLLYTCKNTGRICPPQWQKHWRLLRLQAGFTTWQQDCLRHTFAGYHLRHFRSYKELQYEMGHRDTALLRTRYINMQGIQNADLFWA